MTLAGAWQSLKRAGYGTSLYRASLRGRHPSALRFQPDVGWPGDDGRANALFQGRYRFAGKEARAPNQPPWRLRPNDADWLAGLHRFDWLSDFRAAGGGTARAFAQKLVRSWLDLCSDYDPLIWAPDVLGRRLAAWLGNAEFLLEGADPVFRQAFADAATMQWRHLVRTWQDATDPRARFDAFLGLLYGATVLQNGAGNRATAYLGELDAVLDILAGRDGVCASRSPSDQLAVLNDLLCLNRLLEQATLARPDSLTATVRRMAGALRAMRAGDGALALLNGGYEENADAVSDALRRAGRSETAQLNGGASGLFRLAAGNALLLFDAGVPPLGAGADVHAGLGAFELSVGRHRMITNCGGGGEHNDEWRTAMSRTAAHSAVCIDDHDNLTRDEGGRVSGRAERVRCRRHEDEDGSIWVNLTHDGYHARYGLMQRRRLFVDRSGDDIRGEDSCFADESGPARVPEGGRLTARFHLHPGVQVSPVQGGNAILLKVGGQGWRFRAGGGEVVVEDSVYLGRPGAVRRAKQIVVRAPLGDGETAIKWGLRKA
jgi:uncharacterized heparinase superfamily protein